MGVKLIAILSVLSVVFSVGAALKCYACAGSGRSDCAKGKVSAMVIQPCNLTELATRYGFDDDNSTDDDNKKYQASCFQLYETDYKPKLFARGCGIVPASSDPCTFVSKYIHITGCKSCKTNLCNKRRQHIGGDPIINNTVY